MIPRFLQALVCVVLMGASPLFAQAPVLVTAPELAVQLGHTREIRAAVFSPDGTLLATGAYDQRVVLWDVRTRRQIRTLPAGPETINALAFSHDGKLLASAAGDVNTRRATVTIWDVESGAMRHSFVAATDEAAVDLAFSPSGDEIAVAVHLHDRPLNEEDHPLVAVFGLDGQRHQRLEQDVRPLTVSYSPDGLRLAIATDVRPRMWTLATNTAEPITTGVAKALRFSPDGRSIAMLAEGRAQVVVENVETGAVRELPLPESAAKRYLLTVAWSPDSRLVAVGDTEGRSYVWDAPTATLRSTHVLPASPTTGFEPRVQGLAMNANLLVTAGGDDSSVHAWDLATGGAAAGFAGSTVEVIDATFAPDGALLALAADDSVRRISLDSVASRRYQLARTVVPARGQWIQASANRIAVYRWHWGPEILDAASGAMTCTGKTGSEGGIRIALSADGRLLAGSDRSGKKPEVDVIDTTTCKTTAVLSEAHVNSTAFSPDGRILATSSGTTPFDTAITDLTAELLGKEQAHPVDAAIRLWDARTGKLLRTLVDHSTLMAAPAFSPDGRMIASAGDGGLRIWSVADGRLLQTIPGLDGSVIFTPDGSRLVSEGPNGTAIVDLASGVATTLSTKPGATTAFSPGGRLFAAISGEGTIHLCDGRDGRQLATIVVVNNGGYIIVTPDGYYEAGPGGVAGVAYRVGTHAYPFDQFDLQYNRPDRVLSALGVAPDGLIEAARKAYVRRVRRAGFTEEQLTAGTAALPVATVDTPVPATTQEKTLALTVSARDAASDLARLHVLVNGVPVLGVSGRDLLSRHVRSATESVAVTLTSGANIVEVSVSNANGIESLRERFVVDQTGPAVRPQLYVLAVGVSQYTDQRMNLQYAAKDATDFLRFISASKGSFADVHAELVVDATATRAAILQKARDLFSRATVDDYVLFYVAGHGLLDNDSNYYFAPHDVDFANPATGGLTFDDLSAVLDGTPARRKLLLMDSCHAGGVEKDDAQPPVLAPSVQARAIEVPTGARASRIASTVAPPTVLDGLFVDLERSNGALVLAAAGGFEFAFEGQGSANGVFTHTLLEGLRSGAADANANGSISFTELREYVSQEVSRLTGGRQRPVARQENFDADFPLYATAATRR